MLNKVFENKRNGLVAKVIAEDPKFSTVTIEYLSGDQIGKTANLNTATIKRWWKAIESETDEIAEIQAAKVDAGVVIEPLDPEQVEIINEEISSDGTPYSEVMAEIIKGAEEKGKKAKSGKKGDKPAKSKDAKPKAAKSTKARKTKEVKPFIQDSIDFVFSKITEQGDEIFEPANGMKMRTFKTGGHMYAKFNFSSSSITLAIPSKAIPESKRSKYVPDKQINHMFDYVWQFSDALTKTDKTLISGLLSVARDYRVAKNSKKEEK